MGSARSGNYPIGGEWASPPNFPPLRSQASLKGKVQYQIIYVIKSARSIFYLFSLLTIASAFVVVTTPNPVHAVLFLVSAFAGAGCLLVLFGAEYLGVTFIVVYVGAVAIVFLFVIMMLNIKHATLKESVRGRIARYFPVGGIIAFLSLVAILYVLSKDSAMMVLTALPSESSLLTVSCMENATNSPYLT